MKSINWTVTLAAIAGFVVGVYADSIPVVSTVASKMPGRAVAKKQAAA